MLVVCNGMLRSGSTLQYNLVRLLIEASAKGQGEGFFKEKDYSRDFFQDWKRDGQFHVIKTHGIEPYWLKEETVGKVQFCYIFRDIRDVAVSVKKKFGHSGDRLLSSLDRAVDLFYLMKKLENVLWQRYEEVVVDMIGALKEQANFFNVSVDESTIARIVESCQVDAASKVTENLRGGLRASFKPFLRMIKFSSAIYDKETLLHPDHISKHKGAVGVWKKELAPDEIRIINLRYEKWLQEQGYLS